MSNTTVKNQEQGVALFLQCCFLFSFLFLGLYFFKTQFYLASIFCAFLSGTRFRALGNLMHECAHGTLFETKRQNNFAGFMLSLALWCSFKEYKKSHFSHHLHLGSPEKDLDFCRMPLHWWNRLTAFEILKVVFKLRFLRVFFKNSEWNPFSKLESGYETLVRVIFVSGLFFVCLFAPKTLSEIFWFGIFCFLVPYQMHKYICDLWDHGEAIFLSDQRLRSSNHKIKLTGMLKNKVLSNLFNELLLPRNDGLHLMHHQYPMRHIPTLIEDKDG